MLLNLTIITVPVNSGQDLLSLLITITINDIMSHRITLRLWMYTWEEARKSLKEENKQNN